MRLLLGLQLIALLLTLCSATFGQSFNYTDFSNVSSLGINGAAYQNGNVLALTPLTNWTAGSAYHLTQMDVVTGFDVSFLFQIQPTTIPADGMVFCIHNDPLGTSALATTAGGTLGYSGTGAIQNSLVIEFDTFLNSGENDTSGNEVSVHTRGTLPNSTHEDYSLGNTTPSIIFSDGQLHMARILYTPGILDIFIDNLAVPILSVPYDFTTGGTYINGSSVGGLALAGTKAWVGFTAANGGANETHDINAWIWASSPLLPPCWSGSVTDSQGNLVDVLHVDGSIGGSFRTIDRFVGQPFTITLAQPPANPVPAPFFLWGHFGAVPPASAYTSPFGVMCFTPQLVEPYQPWLFTLADSIINAGVIPVAAPSPWSLNVPGVPTAMTFVLQGLTVQNQATTGSLAITNAIQINTVPYPAPTISQITPISPSVGTQTTVTGTGFRPGATLKIDGQPVPIGSLTATDITFVMLTGVVCDATLTITNSDGQSASAPTNPSPVISNAIFSQGTAAGGQLYILAGQNFAAGLTVTIGGAAATISSMSPAAIQMMTPPGSVGTATVVVTSPTGCTATTTYTYQ